MASNYTENYGLCQWEAKDSFVRTEFNQDNAKIDAAIKAAEAETARVEAAAERAAAAAKAEAVRALEALEPVAYNVYNLSLQNYYGQKETDWKKALIFDGFLDQAGIDSLTGMVWDGPNRSLLLDAVGQGQVGPGFGSSTSFECRSGSSASQVWTATGNGTLTLAETYMTGTATLAVLDGGTLLEEKTVTQNGIKALTGFSFSIPVEAGKSYTFRLTAQGNVTLCVGNSNYTLGLRLSFTPKKATSGNLVTKAANPGNGDALRAWVRHQNGTASLAVRHGSGSWTSLTRTGTRTTVNATGESCTESAFSLSQSLSGSLSFRLSLTASSGVSVRVYDYGVILL